MTDRPAPMPLVAALVAAFPCVEAANDDLVVSRPGLMGGRRVFRGTRVPVEVLLENLDDDMTVEEISDEYPTLRRADVLAIIEGDLR